MILFTIILFIKILLAYILIDFLSGLYHLMTDAGYNLKSQVDLFQEHHVKNDMDGPGFYITAIPALITLAVALYFGSIFGIILSAMVFLVQVPHYYAHVKNTPRFIKWLQDYHLIIGKVHHQKHHKDFEDTFCIVSGWCDPFLNYIIKLISKLKSK